MQNSPFGQPRLSRAPRSLKLLLTSFIALMAVGYVVALANAFDKTGLTLRGTTAHFRGDGGEWSYAQEPSEIIEVSHAHGFSVPMMYVMLGLLFWCTSASERQKCLWLPVPFVGMVLDHATPWLIRYAGSGWTWAFGVGHVLMGVSFLVFIGAALKDMWMVSYD